MRVAAAPISWGVCEVPGWGHQMEPGRVLAEMRDLGLAATELGPGGFLPGDKAARDELLASYGLGLVGAFVPVVLHDPAYDPMPEIDRTLDRVDGILILAAATGLDGYDERPALDTKAWSTLLSNLDAITLRAAARDRAVTLHPHVGTMVESRADVERVLGESSVPLCLDTGHLLVGGTDPEWLARFAMRRITHVHLKDVDAGLADRVLKGDVGYTDAVRDGLYRPLGDGDIDIPEIVHTLEGAGYEGWYVMEQDTVLTEEPAQGGGPYDDVRRSLDFLAGVVR
ncbi:TIM barrel protein [Actinomadura livida]|uniref:Inosose dehydratase n=1 Tax=Actinomadura livida TaxID=79909 RepID=A0A7W7IC08_9ACTN|nr:MULTISPECIES: TIM barrel protein [Actinomadura]MBB4774311.1 inosose dehydratase [Actinomadura catellatispora]GGT83478.1 inosose dehydratase [Actinomadura livida]